ncbi:hypothetical protein [Cellulomonas sp. KRMCY2]|uniref:hypothetical protein n=1 Tax=Cellulomonas sp. KRMCY2 TaxID=1304865 RepID=UPI00045EBCFF|nr:hypothetical protein [Cellulomonas sp. KRMCY2]
MDIRHARFVRSVLDSAESAELEHVDALADQLTEHLTTHGPQIDLVHIHRAQSSAVQTIVAAMLREHLGFREEVVLTPQDGFVTHARPDFVYTLGPGRGIIAEVERGGTTTNSHDLKDLWKTHIAADAQHLFLVVPTPTGTRPESLASTPTPAS